MQTVVESYILECGIVLSENTVISERYICVVNVGGDMVCISTNNGIKYLPELIKSLRYIPYTIIDTGSTDPEFLEYLKTLENVLYTDGGWCLGAYKHAVENIDADWYFFMHDSMRIKNRNFLDKFKNCEVCGWLSFPMFFDNQSQFSTMSSLYPGETPDKGIFGPIFYATKDALDKINIHKPTNIDDAHGMERGIAMAFNQVGVKVDFIDVMDENKLNNDLYEDFTKFRPRRD